jgi:F-type H+-transporting ATPase subunit epsilon
MSLQVKVITPEKVIWSETSDQVVLPAVTGDLGILKDHAPLVTVLDAGVVRKRNAEKWVPLILFGGFAEVENNQVTILGNGAEEISSELTKQEAQEMLDTVSETLEKLKESVDTTEELSKAILEVQIAKARVAALNILSN